MPKKQLLNSTPKRHKPWRVTEADIQRVLGPDVLNTLESTLAKTDCPDVQRIRSAGVAHRSWW